MAMDIRVALLSIMANLAAIVQNRNSEILGSSQWAQVTRPGCPEKCGNVTIPYPFGVGEDCALDQDFLLICDDPHNNPQLLLQNGSLHIIDISLDGHLRKYTYVARDCYNRTGGNDYNIPSSSLNKFFFSSTRNKFTAVGCDTVARLRGSAHEQDYGSGCISVCYSISTVISGSCSGLGCCQTSIPKQLSKFNATIWSDNNHTHVLDFNPCSYAFIADADYFNFTTSSLLHMPDQVPTVVDWAIGDQGCRQAAKNLTSYACKDHSQCLDSDNGPGYRCVCSPGYQGNPYLSGGGGCVDVNECKDHSLNDCTHKCHNIDGIHGNYTCSCPTWFHGDGKRSGQGCTLDKDRIIYIIIGYAVLLILLVAGSMLLYKYRREIKQKKLKENFFKQNGGLILLDKVSRGEVGSINSFKIFKSEELKEATDNFNDSRVCGRGGFGTVFKGHLSDGSVVAIKVSKTVDKAQKEQFINEITILSQIRHRNVVKFLGCCLETPVPLLVYEFITNGTLSDHIHNDNERLMMPWRTRLKIAAETAGVLAYMRSAHSPPIIHRDIKPTNILLDDNYTPKVSDFGASRLVPKNETEVCTMVQGTLGYLDPEYFQTSQLTMKSDVYSFGVVLIELLTGLKAVSFERPEKDRSLVNYLLSVVKEDDMLQILDKGMMNEDNVIKEIMEVIKIAKICLRVKGEERPSMKEVAMELEGLLMESKHKWATSDPNVEESEYLLSEGSGNTCESSSKMAEYSGARDDILSLEIDGGR